LSGNFHFVVSGRRPIGSGEIESAHRYVAQKLLKLSGAWWTVKNAERMIALRIMRLNGE
jgi:hypothetical protein